MTTTICLSHICFKTMIQGLKFIIFGLSLLLAVFAIYGITDTKLRKIVSTRIHPKSNELNKKLLNMNGLILQFIENQIKKMNKIKQSIDVLIGN